MVQYVFTPWRDRDELLAVREQFYGSQDDPRLMTYEQTLTQISAPSNQDGSRDVTEVALRRLEWHQAIARVSMWMQRGHCPHVVESTALLTSAVLSDEESSSGANMASSTYAARAAYAAAFSR